jgi:hypothetical protein
VVTILMVLSGLVVIMAKVGSSGSTLTASQDATSSSDQPTAATESSRTLRIPATTTPSPTRLVKSEHPNARPTSSDRPTLPGIGAAVRDKEFQFKVTQLRCGVKKIGGSYFNVKAQGEFCLVSVRVENVGDKPQTFFGSNQRLFNRKGQEYEASNEAAIYLEDSRSLYEEINPGNYVWGTVVFDVPESMKPDHIELHASLFSAGATVSFP